MLERVAEELRACGGDGGWVLSGSAAMFVAGLPVVPGDVDLFMRAWVFERALLRGWREEAHRVEDEYLVGRGGVEEYPTALWHDGDRPVSACACVPGWRHFQPPDLAALFRGARRVGGLWVIDLRELATWKLAMLGRIPGRAGKDGHHLDLLTAAGFPPYPRVA